MRAFAALFLALLLALPAAQAADFQALCAGQTASGAMAHACCHHRTHACNTETLTAAYCCQPQVPSSPVPISQTLPPAPVVSALQLTPDLPLVEHLAGDHLLNVFAPPPLTAPPPALYQLHRAYRI